MTVPRPGPGPTLACIEVGGSGVQTVVFDTRGARFFEGVVVPEGAEVAVAVPGLLRDGRVVAATNLGWNDVDAAVELGIATPSLYCNDAEAAALGEWVLRDKPPDGLVLVGLGTGVGGAVVGRGGAAVSNVFGHQAGYSDRPCRCGAVGCLETVAAGWALPKPISDGTLRSMASAIATAIEQEVAAAGIDLVVVTGGLIDANARLLEHLAAAMPGERTVVPSVRPRPAKSAAAWGLRHLRAVHTAAD